MSLRLVIFDVDGTLVDSQADILGSMKAAFEGVGLSAPSRQQVLSIVGLSLPQAVARLAPDLSNADVAHVVQTYKDHYAKTRQSGRMQAVLYPGAREAIEKLHAVPDVLLGIATGKSRRGLDALLSLHDLQSYFITTQVADDHPSKPHPSMILTALSEAGLGPEHAVMIGDTTYDMEMARAAGVPFIGVTWGYHPASHLGDGIGVLDDFSDLAPLIQQHWNFANE